MSLDISMGCGDSQIKSACQEEESRQALVCSSWGETSERDNVM
jgi:hypothetical protein